MAEKISLECLKCGKKFKRSLTTYKDTRCPKCGSVDIDLSLWGIPIVKVEHIVVYE